MSRNWGLLTLFASALAGSLLIPEVGLSQANLTPYQPSGWSDKIVASNVMGTHTDTPLTTADTVYVDWAVINNGSAATAARFYTALYVDGVQRTSWYTDPPLNPNYYVYVSDYPLGILAAGTHTLKIITDSTGAISESNESDNTYSKTITVTGTSYPNLTPYQPSGWSDKIVASNVMGTSTDTPLTTADTVYVDWAVINNGSAATAARFYTALYVDGVQRTSWYTDPPLNPNYYAYASDYPLGTLAAGTHTLKIITDSTGTISESNESDNTYSKTITVTGASYPNLTPYQPSGWSDKIVASNVKGTPTDTPLTTADTVYVDWAVINNGNAATAARFYTALYVDGVQRTSWYTDPPLNPNYYAFGSDYQLGTLAAGTHTLKIITDSTGTISESNESDNTYSKTITVTGTSTPGISAFTPNPNPPVTAQKFTFLVKGSGFDPASAEVFFLGPSCPTTTSCVLSNSSLTKKTATELDGSATLQGGAFTVQVRNKSNGAVSKAKGLYVATQGGKSANRVLVLMVDFPDKPGLIARDSLYWILFGHNPSQAPKGSLRDFYKEVSYGKFDLDGNVNDTTIAWVRLPQNSTYYAGGCYGQTSDPTNSLPPCSAVYPKNAQKMVEDAVAAAKAQGLDFGPFDANQDGIVDGLFVIHAGQGGEVSHNRNDIWSHSWTTKTAVDTGSKNAAGNPVSVLKYTTEPEYVSSRGDLTIGVFAHEYGHMRFGLPDLYDTDYTSNGIGVWSLMSFGVWRGSPSGSSPAHLDAWSKYQTGFITPTQVTSTLTSQKIAPVETTATVYQLLSGSPQSKTGEYFLIENRQLTGFDSGLPGSGLLIWHVDESVSKNTNENYPGCKSCTGHYKVQLVQADNAWDLEKKANTGDGGDPYPGVCWLVLTCNTSFTAKTSPNSNLWNGHASGVSITKISASGPSMTATISVTAASSSVRGQGIHSNYVPSNDPLATPLRSGQALPQDSPIQPGTADANPPQ
jgi:M6 family metalloprotease-like protein